MFQLAERFGWTEEQAATADAVTVDWLLAIGGAVDEHRAQQEAERIEAMTKRR